MKAIIFVLVMGLLLMITACSKNVGGADKASDTLDDTGTSSWQTITATEARNIMKETNHFILLDVRTEAEFRESRIEGALLIPYDEIRGRANAELPDKNTVILIYCRSGRRSVSAAADLAALGYTNIYDFGGINNWPYETISE
ncbi:MAG: rhodanese-like domain-containing protein [Firmicutes bacterium]|nr:rhodanese-like domain-containing protein [Bacillota bacterium]